MKITVKFKYIICFLFFEYLLYVCGWPDLDQESTDVHINDNGNSPLHAMVLADTHLLGTRNGHWFDKLRREWQMHRAFQSTITLHRPDVVIFLGDLFDEGKWCSDKEFDGYVSRFHELFSVPEEIKVLVAAGNHDMGFHYSLSPRLFNRFQEAFSAPAVKMVQISGVTFVLINSMAMEGDDCFICKPAKNQIKIIAINLNPKPGCGKIKKILKNPPSGRPTKPMTEKLTALFEMMQLTPGFEKPHMTAANKNYGPFCAMSDFFFCIIKDPMEVRMQILICIRGPCGNTIEGIVIKLVHKMHGDMTAILLKFLGCQPDKVVPSTGDLSMDKLINVEYHICKLCIWKYFADYTSYNISSKTVLPISWYLCNRFQPKFLLYKNIRYFN
ncbi:unnamed protein product, partial [Meganyctiphanes norvegica]